MKATVLADFGSTYTKVTLVEPSTGRLLGQAQAPTTTTTDVIRGYHQALADACAQAGNPELGLRRAASSAGGGLRVAAIGLVEDLTSGAAAQAALNAGARVELVLSGRLDDAGTAVLLEVAPEVILLAGGTDGGNADVVLHNAKALSLAHPPAVVIVACNALVARQAADLMSASGLVAEAVANVMPRIGTLDVEPARRAISKAFLSHVIQGKGLSATAEFHDLVAMPTPEAVLAATELIAAGSNAHPGIGDVMVVDVGGATTDVHSAASPVAYETGLDEPLMPVLPLLRTVQGDLGMRSSARGVLAADEAWLTEQWATAGAGESLESAIDRRREQPGHLPTDDADQAVDKLLATSCVTIAIRRHCGLLHTSLRHNAPPRIAPSGPDLRDVPLVIGTGGVLVSGDDGQHVVDAALARRQPRSLVPQHPLVLLDRRYILAAAGVLSEVDPEAAMSLLTREVLEPATG